jgi:Spy/CpxP family protein refolding chaperone
MKTRSKIFPLSVLLASIFALATLPALTSAEGYSSGNKHRSDRGSMPRCEGKFRHGGGHHHHMQMRGWHGPERMAKQLSVLETEIGIRASQLDVWRDFTDALLMMKQSPRPAGQTSIASETNEPFGRAQRFAEMAIARGEAGDNLMQAIEALRRSLTPEQLARVSEVESRMRGYRQRPSQPGPGPEEPEEPENAPDRQDSPDSEDDSEPTQDAD